MVTDFDSCVPGNSSLTRYARLCGARSLGHALRRALPPDIREGGSWRERRAGGPRRGSTRRRRAWSGPARCTVRLRAPLGRPRSRGIPRRRRRPLACAPRRGAATGRQRRVATVGSGGPSRATVRGREVRRRPEPLLRSRVPRRGRGSPHPWGAPARAAAGRLARRGDDAPRPAHAHLPAARLDSAARRGPAARGADVRLRRGRDRDGALARRGRW